MSNSSAPVSPTTNGKSEILGALLSQYKEMQQTKSALFQWFDIAAQANDLLPPDQLASARKILETAFPAEPFNVKISVIGRFRGGKSTLINALLGGEILPATYTPTTATITHVHFGELPYRATIFYKKDSEFEEGRKKIKEILSDDKSRSLDAEGWASKLLPPRINDSDRPDQDILLVLGAYGVVDGQGNAIPEHLETEVLSHWRSMRALPRFPHQDAIKLSRQEITCTSLEELEKGIQAFTAFTDIAGREFNHRNNSRLFLIDHVEVFGPFSMLASDSEVKLSLIDTPGLSDPREYVIKRVREHLREADCVALNLANWVFSKDDADVLYELYRNQVAQVQQLFVILGQIDNFRQGQAALKSHIRAQRDHLTGQLVNAGLTRTEAQTISNDTPIIPISALATVERRWPVDRVATLDPEMRDAYDLRKKYYPTQTEDGMAELAGTIRQRLDQRGRVRHLVQHAQSGLAEAVRLARETLTAELSRRRSTREEQVHEIELLEGKLSELTKAAQKELKERRADSARNWKEKKAELIQDVDFSAISLNQVSAAQRYVAGLATDAYWSHWKRLDAVRRRRSFHEGDYDSEFVVALDRAVMGGVLNKTKALIRTFGDRARTEFGENLRLAEAAVEGLEARLSESNEQTSNGEVAKALKKSIRARLTKSKEEFGVALEQNLEERFKALTAEFREKAKELVVTWSERAVDDGKGYTGRLRDELLNVIVSFLESFPQNYGRELRTHLSGIGDLAGELNLKVFDDVTQAAMTFIEVQTQAARKSLADRQQKGDAQLKKEEAQLVALATALDAKVGKLASGPSGAAA